MAKQTTRLDRLLLLLDTGSAAATRRTAAEQIGELSAQLEGGAPNLLARVRRLLRSKNWETRVAAANAVDAICKRMPVWDPSSCLKMEHATENGGKTADPLIFQGLERLDIKGVIERGQILVCSTGTEFDDVTDGILDPKERLAAKKQQLRAALGLDDNANLVATKKGDTDIYNMQDTVKDEDVELIVKEVPQTKGKASNKRKAADILDDMQGEPAAGAAEHGLEHLSARERNQLRRKQRKVQRDSKEAAAMGAAEESRNGSKAVVTSQPQDANKVVVESAVAEVVATDPNEWPLGPLCDDLSHDIFDACWEVRHGAAMSLRDILKYHAPAAGKWGGCSKEQQAVDNQVWLEECCIRMLCVLSLDRFGDYVSDPVVAPVRETCAQALGVLLRSLSASCLGHVTRVMQNMQTVADWEVRHGGMLGLKYLIAVRKECIVDEHLHTVLPLMRAAIEGEDDDVRAVAAEALLPLASHMVVDSTCFEWFGKPLLALLWATLEQLDDLTASTAAVMGLIAEMAQHLPSHAAADIGGGTSSDAGLLMQRLYPFFRHSMTSVRRSVLKIAGNLALLCFKAVQNGSSSSNWLLPRLADTLHRVFLNIILEQRPDILASSHLLWEQLLCVAEGHALSHAVAGKIEVWLQAVATPPGHALDQTDLIGTLAKSKACEASERKRALAVARARDSGSGGSALALAVRPDQDADADQGLTNLDDLSASVQMRLSGVRAMGALAWRLQATDGDQTTMLATITALLSAQLGTHAHVGALILAEWAMAASTSTSASYTLPLHLQSMLDAKLETIGQGDYPYLEIGNLSTKWRQELRLLLEDYKVAGIKEAGQVLSANKSDFSALTIMEALKLAQEATEWEARVKSKENDPQKAGKESADKAKRRSNACRQVFVTIGQLQEVQANLHTSVLAAAAEVLVAARNLPPKIAPVIRALMDSLQRESNLDLQRRSAKAMVGLLRLRPNGKVVSNLATYLCEDPTFTPQCSDAPEELERVSMEDLTYLPAADDVLIAATDDAQREARIKKRGATMALQEIARGLGGGGDSSASAFAALPALSARIKDPLVAVFGHVEDGSVLHLEVPKMQELVDALQLARTLAAAVGAEDLKALTALMPLAVRALESKHAPLRQMAARFLSEMCCVDALAGMEIVIRRVLPLLADAANTARRLGATETLYKIITVMDMKVLPYAIFFVDPILGRMSDQHAAVRQTVTKTFATLLRLLPLEAGIPDPEGLSADLVAEKAEKRRFLEQLLDTSKIDNFEIPVKIAADLRRYQQEGVNWMSFMLKYQLHGILCDDMGLGKTLQSICIMASDHHNRRTHFAATRDPAYAPFPSLIVCPPTLVGHWAFEISKFLPDKTLGTAVQFVGSPAERAGLRDRVSSGGDCVVITSYDTLRNDIAFLGNFNWNYCVLDEGHVIKNGKSKTTLAVKTVKANHRLLLSGTPIQNNALELWSLFDFLMPGFLGTEKSFSQLYSKPILASRNAKCTSRESEGGALALEALHRQVLPFMLRRTKTEVLSDLPPKIIQDLMCDLSPLQQRLYNDFAAKHKAGEMVKDALSSAAQAEGKGAAKEAKAKEGGEGGRATEGGGGAATGGAATHIFQALQYLRKLSNHPKLVLSPLHPEMANVNKMLKHEGLTLDDISLAPKLLALRQILWDCGIGNEVVKKEEAEEVGDSAGRHRVLVFAQMKSMLDIIEHDLFKKEMPDVTYLRMDGSTPNARRFEMQQQFNGDPSLDVLLLTTHVGGLGLNLTGADTVVFVEHDWNPMRDLQAMDRAHRIGQKKVVNVYRLITKNTLEEKIMGLQRFKLSIANSIVNEDNASLKSMDTSQLLDLFNPTDAGASQESDSKRDSADAPKEAGGKLSQVLTNLEELWDESQYEEAFNVDTFVSSLK